MDHIQINSEQAVPAILKGIRDERLITSVHLELA
jgi:hypothetical protein